MYVQNLQWLFTSTNCEDVFKTENEERVTVNEEEGVWDPKCNGYPHNVKRFWAPIFTKRSPNMVVSTIIVEDD